MVRTEVFSFVSVYPKYLQHSSLYASIVLATLLHIQTASKHKEIRVEQLQEATGKKTSLMATPAPASPKCIQSKCYSPQDAKLAKFEICVLAVV